MGSFQLSSSNGRGSIKIRGARQKPACGTKPRAVRSVAYVTAEVYRKWLLNSTLNLRNCFKGSRQTNISSIDTWQVLAGRNHNRSTPSKRRESSHQDFGMRPEWATNIMTKIDQNQSMTMTCNDFIHSELSLAVSFAKLPLMTMRPPRGSMIRSSASLGWSKSATLGDIKSPSKRSDRSDPTSFKQSCHICHVCGVNIHNIQEIALSGF